MPKALKFFRKEDGKYHPLYASYDKEHPNFTSELGVEQEFIPDRGREGFSVLALRDPTSMRLFLQLMKSAWARKGVLVTTEVDDEWVDPKVGKDAPAEKLFKKMKPIEEHELPANYDYNGYEDYHKLYHNLGAVKDPNRMTEEEYNRRQNEIAKKYEAAQTDVDRNYAMRLSTKLDREWEDVQNNREQVISAYRFLRSRGYKPSDIQKGLDIWHNSVDKDLGFEEVGGLKDMFFTNPGDIEKLQAFIEELENDPDRISDLRLKRMATNMRRL